MLSWDMGGMKVRVYFGFFAMICFYFYIFDSGSAEMCAALTACFLHELGHLAAMFALGEKPRAVCLYCGGMKLLPARRMTERPKQAVILAAGCTVNLILALTSLAIGAEDFSRVQLATGLLNLLPFSALDGGRLMRLFLPENARRAAAVVTGALLTACITAAGSPPLALMLAAYATAAEFLM